MTITASEFRTRLDSDDVMDRLLASSETLSYDPAKDIDWDAAIDPTLHGMTPEWSTLYGTPLWDRMSEQQRVTLTTHEVCSIMSTGIWFEMILQQMIMRQMYRVNPATSEFQFALTEIADECRHSIMFARGCEKLGAPHYEPKRHVVELARGLKTLATGETAFGATLVAEEILDVMQRDWMRDERVQPLIRTGSKIHVVEESRHMKFARQEVREHMQGISRRRRELSAWVIATAAFYIVSSMVNDGVYAAAGLDVAEAKRAARSNEHHHAMMRLACTHLMDFLDSAGLLTRPAMTQYRKVHML